MSNRENILSILKDVAEHDAVAGAAYEFIEDGGSKHELCYYMGTYCSHSWGVAMAALAADRSNAYLRMAYLCAGAEDHAKDLSEELADLREDYNDLLAEYTALLREDAERDVQELLSAFKTQGEK